MGSTIDVRGITCPMNFVKAKLALESIGEGERLKIMIDDGEPVRNVARSLISEGHKLLGIIDKTGYCLLTVEKVGE